MVVSKLVVAVHDHCIRQGCRAEHALKRRAFRVAEHGGDVERVGGEGDDDDKEFSATEDDSGYSDDDDSASDIPDDAFEKLVKVNVQSTLWLSKLVVPQMISNLLI